jgi:hypothetical protein
MTNPDFTKGEWAYACKPEEPVTILTTECPNIFAPIVCMSKVGLITHHRSNGYRYLHHSQWTLVPLKKKLVLWVNEYCVGGKYFYSGPFKTENETASTKDFNNYTRTIKLVEAEE